MTIALTHQAFPDVYFTIVILTAFLHVFLRKRFWSGVAILWGLVTAYHFVMAVIVPPIVMHIDRYFAFMYPEGPSFVAFALAGWVGCIILCLIPLGLRLLAERVAPQRFVTKKNPITKFVREAM